MTSVPASEKDDDSSTTSGLLVSRVTSRRQACSAAFGIFDDAPGAEAVRVSPVVSVQPASTSNAAAADVARMIRMPESFTLISKC